MTRSRPYQIGMSGGYCRNWARPDHGSLESGCSERNLKLFLKYAAVFLHSLS